MSEYRAWAITYCFSVYCSLISFFFYAKRVKNVLFFILREQRRKTTAAEKGKIIVYRIKRVITKRFPELFRLFNELEDSRKRVGYSMSGIVTGALFMHLLKEGSRNAYTNDRRDAIFAKNYDRHFKLRLPHPDTIALLKHPSLAWSRTFITYLRPNW